MIANLTNLVLNMKNIQERQSDLVNDTCNDCGSYADIGAVIDEHDRVLTIEIAGDDADMQIERLVNAAKARFDNVEVDVIDKAGSKILSLTFAFSAEKMIYQLHNNLWYAL